MEGVVQIYPQKVLLQTVVGMKMEDHDLKMRTMKNPLKIRQEIIERLKCALKVLTLCRKSPWTPTWNSASIIPSNI
jgi:hypothetical protein